MANDDCDLLPHSELKKLEEEVQSLKKGTKSSPDSSVEKLNASLNSMIAIFNDAKNELRIEDEEKELLSKKIDPILTNLKTVIEHNEKIAEGILSIAEMIKNIETKINAVEFKLLQVQQELKERPEQKSEPAIITPQRTEQPSPMQWQQQRPNAPSGFESDPFAPPQARAPPGMMPNQQPAVDPFGLPVTSQNQPNQFGQQPQGSFGAPQGMGFGTPSSGFNQNPIQQSSPQPNFGQAPESQGLGGQPAFGPPPAFGPSEMQPIQGGQNLPPPPPRPAAKKGFFK